MEPPGELDRQRIVPGLRDVADFLDLREFRIRLPALHRSDDAGNRFVPIEHPLQTIAAGAEVADFERRRTAELALDVEQVLEHVRRLAIGHVAQHVHVRQAHQRRRHAAVVRAPAAAPERRVERQIRRQQQRVVATASGQVARHVEPRVAGVLHVEDAGAGAERPLLAGVPRPAEPRREVLLVVENQADRQAGRRAPPGCSARSGARCPRRRRRCRCAPAPDGATDPARSASCRGTGSTRSSACRSRRTMAACIRSAGRDRTSCSSGPSTCR